VLRFFSECQVAECKISERHIAEFRTKDKFPKSHLFEQPNFRTDNCSNFMFQKRQIFEHFVSETSNCQKIISNLFEQTTANWAALFSDNFALRGVFRLG
jgi:hypothetical protein